MKQMRFFAVISIMLFSLSFSGLEKVSAEITEADKTATAGLFSTLNPIALPTDTVGAWLGQNEPNTATVNAANNKFITIVQQTFDSLKTDTTKTRTDLRIMSLAAYSSFLTSVQSGSQQIRTGSSPSATDISYVNLLKINTDASLGLASASLLPADQQAVARNAALSTQNAKISTAISDATTQKDKCSLWNPTNIGACAADLFYYIVKTLLLNIAGFVLWITANIFNYSVQVGILNFSKWADTASLYPIWLIVRQIISLCIIFAGLWLGFMYILNKGDQFKKYIPWVVIFAIFVNFSYPIVRTAIDVSNIISLNIYSATVGGNALTATVTSQDTAGALIMNRLGLQGLVLSATDKDSAGVTSALTSVKTIPGALMVVIFVFYAAYIFFMVSAIMITRTASLVFIIVASPLLLVDSIIPKLGDKAAELRKVFFEQLAVGPIFMIMLALTLKFLTVFDVAAKSGTISGAGSDTIQEFFTLLLMLIMLHIMITVTKSTAGSVGKVATDFMGKMGGFATGAVGGVALGGAGLLARESIGRGAASIRDSKWVSNLQDKGGVGGFAGKHMFNATNSVATSSFDGRNSSFVRTNAEKMGMKLSAGNSMGFEARENKERDDRKTRRNFVSNAIKTKENRMREEYHAIEDRDKKKAYLADNVKDSALRNRLEEENNKKLLATYKSFEDNEQGRKEKSEFFAKNSGDEAFAKRMQEHDNKVASGATDKDAEKTFREETLATNKRMATALEAQSSRFSGNDKETRSTNSLQGGAVATTAPLTGGLQLETKDEATARVESMKQQNVININQNQVSQGQPTIIINPAPAANDGNARTASTQPEKTKVALSEDFSEMF
jgi:hypothetical protein